MKIHSIIFVAILAALNVSCIKEELGNKDKSDKVDKPVFNFATNNSYNLNF